MPLERRLLTAELAEQIVQGIHPEFRLGTDYTGFDLSPFTQIEDQAARVLAAYRGGLQLNGLSSISDPAAEFLSTHEGYLSLGVTSLSENAAASLAKHGVVQLWWLKSLPDNPGHVALARSLAPDITVDLSGLTWLSIPAARELARCDGDTELRLDGLKWLSADLARELSQFAGRSLSLNGLVTLSVHSAAELAGLRCQRVNLEELRFLSHDAAQELARYRGELGDPSDHKIAGFCRNLNKTAGFVLARRLDRNDWQRWVCYPDNEGDVQGGEELSDEQWELRETEMERKAELENAEWSRRICDDEQTARLIEALFSAAEELRRDLADRPSRTYNDEALDLSDNPNLSELASLLSGGITAVLERA